MNIEQRSVGNVRVLSIIGDITMKGNDQLVVTRLLTVFDCFDEESAALASFDPRAGPPGETSRRRGEAAPGRVDARGPL